MIPNATSYQFIGSLGAVGAFLAAAADGLLGPGSGFLVFVAFGVVFIGASFALSMPRQKRRPGPAIMLRKYEPGEEVNLTLWVRLPRADRSSLSEFRTGFQYLDPDLERDDIKEAWARMLTGQSQVRLVASLLGNTISEITVWRVPAIPSPESHVVGASAR